MFYSFFAILLIACCCSDSQVKVSRFLDDGVVGVAVIAWGWVCNGHSLSISKGESLVEVWAMLKAGDFSTNGSGVSSIKLLFVKLVVVVAIKANLWEGHSLGLAIGEGEPLIEVWAMLETVN